MARLKAKKRDGSYLPPKRLQSTKEARSPYANKKHDPCATMRSKSQAVVKKDFALYFARKEKYLKDTTSVLKLLEGMVHQAREATSPNATTISTLNEALRVARNLVKQVEIYAGNMDRATTKIGVIGALMKVEERLGELNGLLLSAQTQQEAIAAAALLEQRRARVAEISDVDKAANVLRALGPIGLDEFKRWVRCNGGESLEKSTRIAKIFDKHGLMVPEGNVLITSGILRELALELSRNFETSICNSETCVRVYAALYWYGL